MPEMPHGDGRSEQAEGGGLPREVDPPREETAEQAAGQSWSVAAEPASSADEASRPPRPSAPARPPRTRTSAALKALIVGLIVLVLLLVFILENTRSVEVSYFGASGNLALGVALLLAAVGGAVLVAVLAVARIAQVRRHARRRTRD